TLNQANEINKEINNLVSHEFFKNKIEKIDRSCFYTYKSYTGNNIRNTVKEILLFLAVEDKEEELIKKLFKEGVCLDIYNKDGKSLFDAAAGVAKRTKDKSILGLLQN
ncbi:hypothetical protein ACFL5N_00760, partial [bacterium]